MPKISIYRKAQIGGLAERAFNLYKQGLSLREVAKMVGKSHVWVANKVKDLSTGKDLQNIPN